MAPKTPTVIAAAEQAGGTHLDANFEQMFRVHYARLVSLLRFLSPDPDGAEDLAQDAFAALLVAQETSVIQEPAAWLRTTAVRRLINESRRRGNEVRALTRTSALPPPTTPSAPSTFDDPQLAAEVRRLPLRQRQAIALVYGEDWSTANAADALGCSEATLRVHLHRARRTLRKSAPPRSDANGGSPARKGHS